MATLHRDTVPARDHALDDGDTESGVMSVTARAAGKVLRLQHRQGLPDHPSRRPAHRVLRAASSERVYLLEHRRRRHKSEVRFIAPPELEDLEVLLCVWLAHLLDAHAATGENWQALSAEWTVVADDFPSRIGPGGFGRGYDEYNGHVIVAYTGG